MCEQSGPPPARRRRRARRAGRLRLLGHHRPLLPLAGRLRATRRYAWTMLGAVAQATERIPLMTYVTCPILRYHPAVVAQQAATIAVLSDSRFTLGLGAGENLNEHVVGARLAAGRRTPRDARGGHGDHPRAVRRRLRQLPRRPLRRRVGEALGPARRAASRSAIAVSGQQSCALAGESADADDRHRAEPELGRDCSTRPAARASPGIGQMADLLRPGQDAAVAARARPVPLVRPAAGRSTPTCPSPSASTARPSSSGPRTSPSRSPAARTSTEPSRR